MPGNALPSLRLQPAVAGTPLTPLQERFNALLDALAEARATQSAWETLVERLHQSAEPVRRELHAAWRDWVFALDQAAWRPGLSRNEQDQLVDMLRETASSLLQVQPDETLAAVLARHGEVLTQSPAAPPPQDVPARPAAPGPEPQDWERQAQEAAAARARHAAQRRAAAAQRKQQAQTQEATHSLREVWRKLASALHPDRALHEAERARKTALMQQANQAYAKGDLMALLDLQHQAALVEAAQQATRDPQRLQRQVQLLEEQLAQLRHGTQRLEASFRAATGASPGSGLQPHKAERLISSQVQRMREELTLLRRQIAVLADVQATRAWLRQVRRL